MLDLNLHGTVGGRVMQSLVFGRGNKAAAASYAASQNWHNADLVQRAAVGGLESSGVDGLAGMATQDLSQAAWPLLVLGQMTHAQRTNFRTPTIQQVTRPTGYWIAQGKAVPHAPPGFARLLPMDPHKVCGLTVATREIAQRENADAFMLSQLAQAVALAANTAFVDGQDGDDSRPAAVNFGVSPIASSNDPAADAAAAIGAFQGDLRTACWITTPAVGASMGLHLNSGGSANNVGALGGFIGGLPCFTSEAVETDSTGGNLILLDQAAVQFAGGDVIELKTSEQGMIEMHSDPTGDTLQPAGATESMISLFQEDAIAFLAVMALGWRVTRANACVVVAGAEYEAA